jgi:hypothetical protein
MKVSRGRTPAPLKQLDIIGGQADKGQIAVMSFAANADKHVRDRGDVKSGFVHLLTSIATKQSAESVSRLRRHGGAEDSEPIERLRFVFCNTPGGCLKVVRCCG